MAFIIEVDCECVWLLQRVSIVNETTKVCLHKTLFYSCYLFCQLLSYWLQNNSDVPSFWLDYVLQNRRRVINIRRQRVVDYWSCVLVNIHECTSVCGVIVLI